MYEEFYQNVRKKEPWNLPQRNERKKKKQRKIGIFKHMLKVITAAAFY